MNLRGFGYTLQFPLICEDTTDKWPVIRRQIDGVTVDIYPPFSSGGVARLTPDFEINSSPSFSRRKITLASYNTIKGFRTIPACFSENSNKQPPQKEANSFQLEVHCHSEQKAERIADWLYQSALRNVRRSTYQFWIGQAPIYFEGNKKITYTVRDGKLLHEETWTNSTFYSGSLRTIVIDQKKWHHAWMTAKREFALDQFDSVIMAHHLTASHFFLDAIYNLAICVEKSKYELWRQLFENSHATKGELKSALNDTKKPERYFYDLLPQALRERAPNGDIRTSITKVWEARGLIAHGKELNLPSVSIQDLDQSTLNTWIDHMWELSHVCQRFLKS